jgi:DNA-binding SARP family transcriptional activator
VTFRVLGAVEVVRDGRSVPLTRQPLTVLAGLLVRANSAVSAEVLANVLWGERPASTRGAVQTYVMRLRRALGPDVVSTTGGGYRIDATADNLDLLRFRQLTTRAERAAARGEDAQAGADYREALELWRGPALHNVASDLLQREDVPALTEQHLSAWEQWAGTQLRLGETPIAELTRLTGEHPLRERFWEQLMLALYRAGRQADALTAYRQVTARLADELGLDPGKSLQQLHQAILTRDPQLDELTPSARVPEAIAVPRQLSAVISGFTGRVDELRQLAKAVDTGTGTSTVLVAIEGAGGVGKTTLAVRFAHEVAAQFPDGQIQLNLHGYGPGEPVTPTAALESLLQSVGVAGEQIPASVDARAALWRTHTSGKALLLVLDNARSSDQVRPLLPGPGGLVLVTSRATLRALIARDGALPVSLERLPDADALALLAQTVGRERVHADEAASRRFVAQCARLPLAIRVLGEHANQRADRPLADIVDEVAADSDRLAYFDLDDGDDTDLRAVFAQSYAALADDAARLFRLLGVHPGRTFGALAAAALAEQPLPDTNRLIDRLVRAHLLEQPRPGRYEFHDLLREFAAALARQDDEAQPALDRVLDWYAHAALRAGGALRGRPDDDPVPPGLLLPAISDYQDARDWYVAECDSLLAAVDAARARQLHWHVCQVALSLGWYFSDVPILGGWFATHEIALDSARIDRHRRAEGRLLNSLGIAHIKFGTLTSALDCCRSAQAIAQELGRRDDEFAALNNIGLALWLQSDHEGSIEFTEQALAVAQQLDPEAELLARGNLADNYVGVGRFDEARIQAEAALDLVEPSSDPNFRAYALVALAGAQAGLHDHEASRRNYESALALFVDVGGLLGQSQVLERMGDLHAEVGDPSSAARRYQEALDLLVKLGHRDADRLHSKLAGIGLHA